MSITSMDTCSHPHNNNSIKQKKFITIISNLIYIFMDLYLN